MSDILLIKNLNEKYAASLKKILVPSRENQQEVLQALNGSEPCLYRAKIVKHDQTPDVRQCATAWGPKRLCHFAVVAVPRSTRDTGNIDVQMGGRDIRTHFRKARRKQTST